MPSKFISYRKYVVGKPESVEGNFIDQSIRSRGRTVRIRPVKVTIGPEIPSVLPGIERTEGPAIYRAEVPATVLVERGNAAGEIISVHQVHFNVGRYRIDEIEARINFLICNTFTDLRRGPHDTRPFGLTIVKHMVSMRIDHEELRLDFSRSNIAEVLGFEKNVFVAGVHDAPHRNRLHDCPEIIECLVTPIIEGGGSEDIPFSVTAQNPFDVTVETAFPSIDIDLNVGETRRDLHGFQFAFNRRSSFITTDALYDYRTEPLILADGGFIEVILQIDYE